MQGPIDSPAHGYNLRSRRPVVDALDILPATLSEKDDDVLLRATLDRRGGICSTRPPPKKVQATSAAFTARNLNYDNVFGSSDLTELEYSDPPAAPQVAPPYDDAFGSSDLTDLEDWDRPATPPEAQSSLKRRRRGPHRSQEGKRNEIRSGRVRLARKAVTAAQMAVNTVHLEHFSMEKAVTYTMRKDTNLVECEESVPIILDGDVPQRVVSADGYDLIYRFPAAFQGKALDYVSGLCEDWGHIAKIKSSVANDKKGRYKDTKGELTGTTRLCTLWHAIGHKCDDPTPSMDMLHSGTTFRAAVNAIAGLDMVSAYVMAVLQAIDPTQHSLLETLWRKTCEKETVQQMFDSINGGLAYEGREVVFNRESHNHWDQHDPHWSWSTLLYFGTFKLGRLRYPQLNLTVMLRPGDLIFHRGRDMMHNALAWGRGSRNFLVHFTHQHMWDYIGLTCASQKATNVHV